MTPTSLQAPYMCFFRLEQIHLCPVKSIPFKTKNNKQLAGTPNGWQMVCGITYGCFGVICLSANAQCETIAPVPGPTQRTCPSTFVPFFFGRIFPPIVKADRRFWKTKVPFGEGLCSVCMIVGGRVNGQPGAALPVSHLALSQVAAKDKRSNKSLGLSMQEGEHDDHGSGSAHLGLFKPSLLQRPLCQKFDFLWVQCRSSQTAEGNPPPADGCLGLKRVLT